MPSFDIVSEVDLHEVSNAVDQANREVTIRFDFKDSNAVFEQKESEILMKAQSDFQLQQMADILRAKMTKRSIEVNALEFENPICNLNDARQTVKVKQGIETDLAKKMVKTIKASKIKVQAAIQGDQLRITGKKRDELQETIAYIKEQKYALPLQFINFRD